MHTLPEALDWSAHVSLLVHGERAGDAPHDSGPYVGMRIREWHHAADNIAGPGEDKHRDCQTPPIGQPCAVSGSINQKTELRCNM